MSGFQKVEGCFAIIFSGGVYKQVDVYTWDGFYFLNAAGGFIGVNKEGHTTHPKIRLVHLSMLDRRKTPLRCNDLGRLCNDTVEGAKPLTDQQRLKLEAPS